MSENRSTQQEMDKVKTQDGTGRHFHSCSSCMLLSLGGTNRYFIKNKKNKIMEIWLKITRLIIRRLTFHILFFSSPKTNLKLFTGFLSLTNPNNCKDKESFPQRALKCYFWRIKIDANAHCLKHLVEKLTKWRVPDG